MMTVTSCFYCNACDSQCVESPKIKRVSAIRALGRLDILGVTSIVAEATAESHDDNAPHMITVHPYWLNME